VAARQVEIDAAGSRPGFRQKSRKRVESNPHQLVENLAANLVESQVCSWLE